MDDAVATIGADQFGADECGENEKEEPDYADQIIVTGEVDYFCAFARIDFES